MDRFQKSYQHDLRSPSFSSTLLDSIYRSIDGGDVVGYEAEAEAAAAELVCYRETMRKKQSISGIRAEKWVDKITGEDPILRQNIRPNSKNGFQKFHRNKNTTTLMKSSSSSSESSSETEYGFMRPKPVRTGSISSTSAERTLLSSLQRKTQLPEIHIPKERCVLSQQKPKQESFNKSKSMLSSKFNGGDLKKPKQPVSPGARLAGFLNSLFATAGNAKKAKVSTVDRDRKSKSDRSSPSTCSSASSFSRSCLSKTPSSRGNSMKSVRFYPVSVIVDEDCRPCGQKSLYEREHHDVTVGKKVGESRSLVFGEELKRHLMQKNRQVEEAAKDLLKGYQKKSEFLGEVMRDIHANACNDDDEEDDDEFNDAMSCSSSDLFELENFTTIGIDRYREELPVYETTRFDTNRAIANGFIR